MSINTKFQELKANIFDWVKEHRTYLILLFIGLFSCIICGIGFLNEDGFLFPFAILFALPNIISLPVIIGYSIKIDALYLGDANKFARGMIIASRIFKILMIPSSIYLYFRLLSWYEDLIDHGSSNNFEDLLICVPEWLKFTVTWLSVYIISDFISFFPKLYITLTKKNR